MTNTNISEIGILIELLLMATNQTFHRIRINRTNRVRAKARKRRADERDDLPMDAAAAAAAAGCSANTPCPICGEKMYGTAEELNMHVVQCLRRVIAFIYYHFILMITRPIIFLTKKTNKYPNFDKFSP